jgi:hypothetical protein
MILLHQASDSVKVKQDVAHAKEHCKSENSEIQPKTVQIPIIR